MLDAWSPPRELSPPRKRSRQMGRSNVASFAPMVPSDHRSVAMFRGGIVLLVVLALGFVACTTGSVMNARFHGLASARRETDRGDLVSKDAVGRRVTRVQTDAPARRHHPRRR